MSKTRLQLVRRAIKETGIIPLSTETYGGVDELVDGMVESMQDRNVLDAVFDVSSIDERLFQPLAKCLAYAAAPELGVQQDVYNRLIAEKGAAEQDLVKMQAERPTWRALKVDYF